MHYRVTAQWNSSEFIELEIAEWKYEYLWTKRYIELRNNGSHGVFRKE